MSRDMTLAVPIKTSGDTVLGLTAEQRATLEFKLRAYQQDARRLAWVTLFRGSVGLPDDYVYAVFRWTDGSELHGGIAPDGAMST